MAPSSLPELMDQPCSFEELRACLKDLAWLNRLTGAYRPTLEWLDRLVKRLPQGFEPLRIVDVGCGYGDTLRRIAVWAADRRVPVRLVGLDLNADTVRIAREATPPESTIEWIHGDAFAYPGEVDVVLSSLVTHHLEEGEIVAFLRWMEQRARLGWFLNDLHRKETPYRLFGWMGRLLPLHRFVKHDGLVSIRRSFLEEDWQRMGLAAGLSMEQIAIQTARPARLCVGRMKI
ncbi:MAG TPA: methyltransferase domain-containing protein [Granulicella sp.]